MDRKGESRQRFLRLQKALMHGYAMMLTAAHIIPTHSPRIWLSESGTGEFQFPVSSPGRTDQAFMAFHLPLSHLGQIGRKDPRCLSEDWKVLS